MFKLLELVVAKLGQASALGVKTKEMVFAVIKVSATKVEELLPTVTPLTRQE